MIREYVIEYAEDRIGISVESWGVRAWEWARKVRGYVGVESAWVWDLKVRGCGRGKCLGMGLGMGGEKCVEISRVCGLGKCVESSRVCGRG